MLIGWAEVGPGFLRAIGESGAPETEGDVAAEPSDVLDQRDVEGESQVVDQSKVGPADSRRPWHGRSLEELLEHARREDAAHRVAH